MKKHILVVLITFCFSAHAQSPEPYEINYQKDVPLLLSGLGSFVTGNILLNQVEGLNNNDIQNLHPSDINFFDKTALDNYSTSDNVLSDILVTTASIAPFATLLDQQVRNDFLTILIMGTEVVLINNGLNTITKALVKRPRPFVYNENVANELKFEPYARYSFYSAHTSNAASLSFFTASIISSYSNNKTLKTIVWSGAFILPITTGYLRYSAGKHYPTDVIVGFLMGASVGYFVPLLHRKKNDEFQSFDFETNGVGLTIRYNF